MACAGSCDLGLSCGEETLALGEVVAHAAERGVLVRGHVEHALEARGVVRARAALPREVLLVRRLVRREVAQVAGELRGRRELLDLDDGAASLTR